MSIEGVEEKMSLIATSNKIASLKDGKVVLEKANLKAIIEKVTSEQSESTKSLPIALVSVLGADDNDKHWRQQYTDWIIYHHENSETCSLPVETNAPDKVNFLYIHNKDKEVPGDVYIWPRPFKVKSHKKPTELFCWIVYVSSDHQDGALLNNTFVGCASSKIVVPNSSEQEKLAKQLKPIKKMGYSRKPAFIKSLATHKNKIQVGEDFLKKYEKKKINPKGKIITLENFMTHFEDIVSKINSMDQCKDNRAKSKHKFGSLKIKKFRQQLTGATKSKDETTPYLPKISKIETDDKTRSSSTTADNEQNEEEPNVHVTIDIGQQLVDWIETKMTLSNVKDLSESIVIEDYKMKEDTFQLQEILTCFIFELQNMFDNYVCFGERDMGQMLQFFGTAKDRLEKKYNNCFENASHSHPIFHIDTFTCIVKRIYSLYQDDNKRIAAHEKKLFQTIEIKVETFYTDSMTSFITKNEGNLKSSELDVVHKKIIQALLGMISRCMDYGGRLNDILKKCVEQMETNLNVKFNELKTERNIQPEVPENVEFDLESFPAKITELDPHLIKYSSKELCDLYNKWNWVLSKIFDNKSEKDSLLQLGLSSHLAYVLEKEVEKEQLEKTTSSTNNPNQEQITGIGTLYYQMKGKQVKLIGKFQNKSKVGSFPTDGRAFDIPARMAWNKSNNNFVYGNELEKLNKDELNEYEVVGNISDYITNSLGNDEKDAGKMVESFFYNTKLKSEDETPGVKFNQVVIIIPSVYSTTSRRRIRECTIAAGFQNTFICNESSLLAYRVFNDEKDVMKNISLVAMIVQYTGVRVEIFGSTHSNVVDGEGKSAGIRMIGIAEQNWASEVNSENPPEDFSSHLDMALKNCLAQLPLSKQNGPKQCIIICEKTEWQGKVTELLKNREENIVVNISSKHATPLDVGLQFFNNPNKLRNRILDYPVPIFDDEESSASGVYGQEMGSMITTINSDKANELLAKCDIIEQQINSGKVQIGVLRKKICLETIKRTRDTVSMGMSLDNVEEDLNELIIQHKIQM